MTHLIRETDNRNMHEVESFLRDRVKALEAKIQDLQNKLAKYESFDVYHKGGCHV